MSFSRLYSQDVNTQYHFLRDPLNRLMNWLFLVISISSMLFVYLAFDIAPKEVVWYCKIVWMGDCIWNLKTRLQQSGIAILTNFMRNDVRRNCSYRTFPCRLSGQCFQTNLFLIWGLYLLTWSCSTRLLSLWLLQSIVYRMFPSQIDALKQWIWEHIRGIPNKMLQHVVTSLYHDCRSVLNDVVTCIILKQ
jgi:hypothetical protein